LLDEGSQEKMNLRKSKSGFSFSESLSQSPFVEDKKEFQGTDGSTQRGHLTGWKCGPGTEM
jgi:hypothetical protein